MKSVAQLMSEFEFLEMKIKAMASGNEKEKGVFVINEFSRLSYDIRQNEDDLYYTEKEATEIHNKFLKVSKLYESELQRLEAEDKWYLQSCNPDILRRFGAMLGSAKKYDREQELRDIEERETAKYRGQAKGLEMLFNLIIKLKKEGVNIDNEMFSIREKMLALESKENNAMIQNILDMLK